MTPGEFIAKWSDSTLRERAAAQSHFIDLCKMLARRRPPTLTPGESGTPSRGALETGGVRLGRRVEARLLRVGIQEAGQGPTVLRFEARIG